MEGLFQSTLPREERLNRIPMPQGLTDFNPRSHERSDSFSAIMFCITKYFNPRSHERSDCSQSSSSSMIWYFNPRSHERSDSSILQAFVKLLIFQSTLPREERRKQLCTGVTGNTNFNPRSHERSDGDWERYIQPVTDISIHAPTRGATGIGFIAWFFFVFQSTLPREERRSVLEKYEKDFDISIHAPTRGATCWPEEAIREVEISIHAPTRGATVKLEKLTEKIEISIHAPTRGATYALEQTQALNNFNPRSHERSDGCFAIF